jgi:hypothetical protein
MMGGTHARLSGEAGKFLARAQATLASDDRISALLVAGSAIDGAMDEYSDLDLIVVSPAAAYDSVMDARRQIAEGLGDLHAAFTGEHVGEPRLLICLYGDPLLHVDLKFVTIDDLDRRVETPLLVWSRSRAVQERLRAGTSQWPNRPPEWFEERFWVWVHYGATKVGRGENMEAIHMLDFLRDQVLGPLIARSRGRDQRGVRRLEQLAPELQDRLQETLGSAEKASLKRAYLAAIALYRDLRAGAVPDNLRISRENAVCRFVEAV